MTVYERCLSISIVLTDHICPVAGLINSVVDNLCTMGSVSIQINVQHYAALFLHCCPEIVKLIVCCI